MCRSRDECPLENARLLTDKTSTKAPDLTSLLPRAVLCTFSKAMVESIVAVAKAPKGGGSSDISTAAIAKPAGVVKAALNGACSWEDAGLELAGRMEDATTESARLEVEGRDADPTAPWGRCEGLPGAGVELRHSSLKETTIVLTSRLARVALGRRDADPTAPWGRCEGLERVLNCVTQV